MTIILSPGFVRHHMKWSSWRRDSVENLALIRPVRTGHAGRRELALDSNEHLPAVKEGQCQIEDGAADEGKIVDQRSIHFLARYGVLGGEQGRRGSHVHGLR